MNGIYEIILILHNLLRWVVLVLGVLAAVRAFMGWLQGGQWTEGARKLGSFYGIVLDIQVLLGLLLYFVFSPMTTAALRDFGAAMGNPDLRFFAVEHLAGMLAAVILAHLGSALPRRAAEDGKKYRLAAIFITLSLLAVLTATPWTRPLLRF